jgi:hypothetical protein
MVRPRKLTLGGAANVADVASGDAAQAVAMPSHFWRLLVNEDACGALRLPIWDFLVLSFSVLSVGIGGAFRSFLSLHALALLPGYLTRYAFLLSRLCCKLRGLLCSLCLFLAVSASLSPLFSCCNSSF